MIGAIISSCKSNAVISSIPKSFSISSLTFMYEIPPLFLSGNLYSSNLLFCSVMLKIEFYTSRSINPNIQSSLTRIGGLK